MTKKSYFVRLCLNKGGQFTTHFKQRVGKKIDSCRTKFENRDLPPATTHPTAAGSAAPQSAHMKHRTYDVEV